MSSLWTTYGIVMEIGFFVGMLMHMDGNIPGPNPYVTVKLCYLTKHRRHHYAKTLK